jgi:hypothetical protein
MLSEARTEDSSATLRMQESEIQQYFMKEVNPERYILTPKRPDYIESQTTKMEQHRKEHRDQIISKKRRERSE